MFITSESIGRCGRRTLGRPALDAEALELEPGELVVPPLLQVAIGLLADREQTVVGEVDDGAAGEAWTYIYNWPVTGLPRITSGKFLES